MKKGHAAAFAMIIFTVMVWGFSFISIKVSLQQIPPMSLGLYRFIVAVAILFVAKRIISPGEKITRSDLPLLFGAGMTGVTFYFYSENNGLSLTTASEASIIIRKSFIDRHSYVDISCQKSECIPYRIK